jgi:hypothetical protein
MKKSCTIAHGALSLFVVASFLILSSVNSHSQGNNVLLEFCTGTWCQWCPCGDVIAQNILNTYPNTLVLAEHGGGGGDPFQNFPGNEINGPQYHNWSLYPTGCIGRRTGSVVDREDWISTVVSQNSMTPGVSFTVNKTYNPTTRVLSATVLSRALQNLAGNYYISYVITEDNVIYQQTGNSSCPGSSNYVHKWIVRAFTNTAAGTQISTGIWLQDTVITSTMSYTLPAAWNASNCKFAVFVYLQAGQFSTTSFIQQTSKTTVTGATGIENENQVPKDFFLSQNYPNPFNPTTNILFSLPKDGNASLKIYIAVGSEVATYLDGFIKAGTYNAEFDGSNLPSGVYFYTLRAAEYTETRKMVLLK